MKEGLIVRCIIPARLMTFLFAAAVLAASPRAAGQQLGYADTPRLPNSPWRVHDGARPQPVVVKPGDEASVTPPADAVVLFDGRDLAGWRRAKDGGPAGWRVEGGAMVVAAGTGDIASAELFGDMQLHLEWATPSAVAGTGQGRGNSGVFLMERYEIQVLDSFENPTYPDGQAGSIYGQMPPLVNASRAPGEWQSFDIVFRAPRFANGAVTSPARVTVIHNGVVVQDAVALIGATAHRVVGTYEPHADRAAIKLQDHGNPVRFRNIWARRLGG